MRFLLGVADHGLLYIQDVETKAEVTALERNCSRVSGVLTSINTDLSNLITRKKP